MSCTPCQMLPPPSENPPLSSAPLAKPARIGIQVQSSRLLLNELQDLADWIFTSIGTVTHDSPSLMNAASVTGASTVAFFAIALEGVIRGAVEMGLEESDALQVNPPLSRAEYHIPNCLISTWE